MLSGPYETLVRLLAKLEAATPPLVVDNLHIQGGSARRPAAGSPATPGPATPALDAGLDVYGFRANENPVAAKP